MSIPLMSAFTAKARIAPKASRKILPPMPMGASSIITGVNTSRMGLPRRSDPQSGKLVA
jgi:hypothetical protein